MLTNIVAAMHEIIITLEQDTTLQAEAKNLILESVAHLIWLAKSPVVTLQVAPPQVEAPVPVNT